MKEKQPYEKPELVDLGELTGTAYPTHYACMIGGGSWACWPAGDSCAVRH
jgi:hypothetical protein